MATYTGIARSNFVRTRNCGALEADLRPFLDGKTIEIVEDEGRVAFFDRTGAGFPAWVDDEETEEIVEFDPTRQICPIPGGGRGARPDGIRSRGQAVRPWACGRVQP